MTEVPMTRLITTLATLAIVPSALLAQWGPGGCAVAQTPGVLGPTKAPLEFQLRWENHDDKGEQLDLMRGPFQIGSWHREYQVYRPLVNYHANTWGQPCEPPIPVPEAWRPSLIEANFGINLLRFDAPKSGSHYTINGKKANKNEVLDALQKGLPDDRTKLRFTVIGSKEKR